MIFACRGLIGGAVVTGYGAEMMKAFGADFGEAENAGITSRRRYSFCAAGFLLIDTLWRYQDIKRFCENGILTARC